MRVEARNLGTGSRSARTAARGALCAQPSTARLRSLRPVSPTRIMGSKWLTLCGTSDNPRPRSARKPSASIRSPSNQMRPRTVAFGSNSPNTASARSVLPGSRCAHHSHDLARVDGDVQPVEHLDIALLRLEVRRILVVHAEAHVQILDLQKVVPAVMVRRRRMCVMMVRLRILVRSLLVSDRGGLVRRSRLRSCAVVCILQHLPHLFLRRMRVNELSQALTSHIEEQHRRHERQTREHGKPPGTRR